MAALAASRNTPFRGPVRVETVLMKANGKAFQGGMVATDATGYGIQGATATSLTVAGMALNTVDNTGGSSGAISVDVLIGEFYYLNDGGDPVDQTMMNKQIFMTDDQTVCKTNGGATKSAAGICSGFDANGVWVKVGVL
jgi:hypothetical protein